MVLHLAMAALLIGIGLFIHEKRKAKKQAKREYQQHLEDLRASNARRHNTTLQSSGNDISSSNRQYEDPPPSYEQAMASRSSLEALGDGDESQTRRRSSLDDLLRNNDAVTARRLASR